jgi:hypothetical protein
MPTLEEKIEIVLLMAKFNSPKQVIRELKKKKWRLSQIPSRTTIYAIYTKFKETGSVLDKQKCGRNSLNTDKSQEIVTYFAENPCKSIRKGVKTLNLSYGSIQKYLRADGMHPYKLQMHQKLDEEDCAHRKSMCEDLIKEIDADATFLSKIIFSDESTFHLEGVVNRHNCRVWGMEPPVEVIQKCHTSPKINVWMGISIHKMYGPFFFEGNLTKLIKIIQFSFFSRKYKFSQLPFNAEK